jgi:two-component system response regulator HydG
MNRVKTCICSNPTGVKMKILIVDDDSVMLSLMERMLSGESYRVKTATNVEEALRAYRRFEPDLVITDIQMPRQSGLELIKGIRTLKPSVNVIYMSGSSEKFADQLEREKREFAADYLPKPFAIEDLISAVSTHSHRRRRIRENAAA